MCPRVSDAQRGNNLPMGLTDVPRVDDQLLPSHGVERISIIEEISAIRAQPPIKCTRNYGGWIDRFSCRVAMTLHARFRQTLHARRRAVGSG